MHWKRKSKYEDKKNKIQEELVTIEYERKRKVKETNAEKPKTWSEEVSMMLSKRHLEIRNDETKSAQMNKNANLTDKALSCVKMKVLKKDDIVLLDTSEKMKKNS